MVQFDFDEAGGQVASAINASFNYTEAAFSFSIGIRNGDSANVAIVNTTLNALILTNNSAGTGTVDQFFIDPSLTGFTKFTGNVQIDVDVRGTWFANGTALNAGVNTLVNPGNEIVFTSSGPAQNFLTIHTLTGTLNCFLTGTRIATPTGEVPIESLQPGDRILTTTGEARVKWLGKQSIAQQFQHPDKINPICISAKALGDTLPKNDLYVSANHAVSIDGLLINANALVNGTTIYQVAQMPQDGFAYYHIETDAHELILAEGLPAETYLHQTNDAQFDNATARPDTAPMVEMDIPRISSARLLPDHIRAKIAPERAA